MSSKFCVNCKYFYNSTGPWGLPQPPRCLKASEIGTDLVRGLERFTKIVTCEEERQAGACGEAGANFEPRAPESVFISRFFLGWRKYHEK
jgi:hypothetical protein